MRRLPRLLAGLAVATLVLGAVELAARQVEAAQGRPVRPEEQDPSLLPGNLQIDPVLGWRPRPGQPGDDADYHAWAARWGRPVVAGPPVGEDGLRDDARLQGRPADQRTLVFLGDSSVWGWGVSFADTMPGQLEARLNGGALAPADRPVEVLNTGVPGYSSYQALLRLQAVVDAGVQPDGILVYWGNSDMPPPPFGTPDAAFYEQDAMRVGASLVYRLATGRLLRRWLRPPESQGPAASSRVPPSGLRRNLQRLGAAARDLGAFVVVVVPPLPADLGANPDAWRVDPGTEVARQAELLAQEAEGRRVNPAMYRTALVLEARAQGFGLVDGPAALREADRAAPGRYAGADALFVDAVHPSAHGHGLLAEAILPEVCARLPGGAPGCR